MITEDEYNLRPIWDAIFSIYKVVEGICDRHGLRYYVTDGTLIGAIRHKGFIPWDDDFDMSMPRSDYEKFIEIAKTELPPHLKFVNWKNTPEMSLLFGKVQDSRVDEIVRIEKETGRSLSNGLFVDIFPIDGYPTNPVEIATTRIRAGILGCMIRFKTMKFSQQTLKGKIVWLMGLVFSLLLPWLRIEDCMRICERFLTRHPFEDSDSTGRADLRVHMLNSKPLPRSAWGTGSLHEFHTGQVRIPDGYDMYLRSLYGEYMTLPPESARHPSHGYLWRCPWCFGPTNK